MRSPPRATRAPASRRARARACKGFPKHTQPQTRERERDRAGTAVRAPREVFATMCVLWPLAHAFVGFVFCVVIVGIARRGSPSPGRARRPSPSHARRANERRGNGAASSSDQDIPRDARPPRVEQHAAAADVALARVAHGVAVAAPAARRLVDEQRVEQHGLARGGRREPLAAAQTSRARARVRRWSWSVSRGMRADVITAPTTQQPRHAPLL